MYHYHLHVVCIYPGGENKPVVGADAARMTLRNGETISTPNHPTIGQIESIVASSFYGKSLEKLLKYKAEIDKNARYKTVLKTTKTKKLVRKFHQD